MDGAERALAKSGWMDIPKTEFRNAKVVSDNVSLATYLRQSVPRGHPEYIMSRSDLVMCYYCAEAWIEGAPDESTKSTIWGTVVDCMLTMPEQFDSVIAVTPEFYKGKAKHARKGDPLIEKPWNSGAGDCAQWELEREALGMVICPFKEKVKADRAVARVRKNQTFMAYLGCSRKQVLVIGEYYDRKSDIAFPVKCLNDLVPRSDSKYGRSLADLKTTATPDPRGFSKAIFDMDMDIQGAMHTDLYVAATGEDRIDFRHLIIGNKEPFQPACRIMHSGFMEMGRIGLLATLQFYAKCLKTKTWPNFEDRIEAPIEEGWGLSIPEEWMQQRRYLM